jgi:hypothetical protein
MSYATRLPYRRAAALAGSLLLVLLAACGEPQQADAPAAEPDPYAPPPAAATRAPSATGQTADSTDSTVSRPPPAEPAGSPPAAAVPGAPQPASTPPPEPPSVWAVKVTATELRFREQEPGGEPHETRMLVTAGHLRLDDGSGRDGFLLYDRAARTVYSVARRTGTAIAVSAVDGEVESPLPLQLEERRREPGEGPTIGGVRPLVIDFMANGRHCLTVAVVPGLLDAVREAEREYLEVLASEQRANVGKIPPQMLEPCDLSRYLFAPVRHLAAGYPVEVTDPAGGARSLLGFEAEVEVDPELFELPPGYTVRHMHEMR